jgi:hypothetical protein
MSGERPPRMKKSDIVLGGKDPKTYLATNYGSFRGFLPWKV